jgi:hypothetical protein
MIWIILLSAGLSAAIVSDDCQSVGAWFGCFGQQIMALTVCNPKFEDKHVVLDSITSGDLTMLSIGRILDPEMLVRWSAFHLLDSS